ncbi:MAG: PilZ domain-containing protein [Oligoflexia bacterium]|nr:PilZ domain-containing protein [Oligoflexia bacterium]
MEFLKRWFRREKTEAPEAPMAAKAPQAPKAPTALPARPPRIRMLPLHAVSFRVTDPAALGEVSVANISAEGIGLVPKPGSWPAPGGILAGELRIGEGLSEVKAEVRHANERLVGCRFVQIPEGFRDRVLQAFFTELSALRMVRVNPEVLQRVDDGVPSLFVGDNGCELYLVEGPDGVLVRFTISFFGNVLEGGADGKLQGGQLQDEDSDGEPRYKGSAMHVATGPVSEDLLLTARKLLSNVEGLSPATREKLNALLTRS